MVEQVSLIYQILDLLFSHRPTADGVGQPPYGQAGAGVSAFQDSELEVVHAHDYRGAEQDRRLDALATAVAVHDPKLDVLAAQVRLLIGAMGLLVTVLLAVFGFLFANTN